MLHRPKSKKETFSKKKFLIEKEINNDAENQVTIDHVKGVNSLSWIMRRKSDN